MTNSTITNEMLYKLLKEFKEDVHKRFEQVDKRFEQVDKRFEQVDKRFEQVDKRFEEVDKRFGSIENNLSEDHDILMDLWKNRSKQNLNFTSVYFIITLISSILAAIATSSFLN